MHIKYTWLYAADVNSRWQFQDITIGEKRINRAITLGEITTGTGLAYNSKYTHVEQADCIQKGNIYKTA